MFDKPFDTVTAEDIEGLVRNNVRESRFLDYKRSLPTNSEDDIKDLLCDIISFANTAGGFIIYGVDDKRDAINKTTGEPEPVGLNKLNFDTDSKKIHQWAEHGIDPQIVGLSLKPFSTTDGKTVVVLNIPDSWSKPHMVCRNKRSLFYMRNDSGKYQLDREAIRRAFLESEDVIVRIHNFRGQRLDKILSKTTYVDLYDEPKLVLHFVPVRSMVSRSAQVNLKQTYDDRNGILREIIRHTNSRRYNLDGVLSFSVTQDGKSPEYLQIYRDGKIEAVSTFGFPSSTQGHRLFPYEAIEKATIAFLQRAITYANQQSITPPFSISLSILQVRGFVLAVNHNPPWDNAAADRDNLILDDTLVIDSKEPVDILMRSAFDQMWNAFGWESCKSYDQSGRWKTINRN